MICKLDKNNFKLAGGSSYRGFELLRVRVATGKINRFWFELARGSSYRESTELGILGTLRWLDWIF